MKIRLESGAEVEKKAKVFVVERPAVVEERISLEAVETRLAAANERLAKAQADVDSLESLKAEMLKKL